MSEDIVYKFTGQRDRDGNPLEYAVGIPARDLTAADVQAVKALGLIDELEALPIYRQVSATKSKSEATTAASAVKEG